MNEVVKKPSIEYCEFSESRLGRIIEVAQDLLDDYLCRKKKFVFVKSYPKNAYPINELQYLQGMGVIRLSFDGSLEIQYALIVEKRDPENINVVVVIDPTKLKELLIVMSKSLKKATASEPVKNAVIKNELKGSYEYKLELTKNNQILINDFLLSEPRSGENIATLKVCIKNPSQEITKERIEKETKNTIGKKFHTIISNYGFTSAMRKAFFPKITKEYVIFENPVSLPSPLKFPRSSELSK